MPHSSHRSSRFLNTLTVSAMTTDSGNLFQCGTTRWLKKFLLNSNLLLLVYSFNSCPLVPYRFLSCVKKQYGSTPSLPVKILYVSMRSPRCLLFSSEVSFSHFSLSSYSNLQKPLTTLVALLWTLSMQSISLHRYGDQACMAYSKWGLTKPL